MTVSLDPNTWDSIIGNPSTSRVIRFLTIHPVLSVKQLMDFIGISESQIHLILKNMTDINLVKRQSRGLYSLSQEKSATSLKEAYKSRLLEYLNQEIYEIQEQLKLDLLPEAKQRFRRMSELYQPLLKTHFKKVMSSLSHEFLDRI